MLWPSMEPFCAIAEMLQQPKIAESRSRWKRAKDFISRYLSIQTEEGRVERYLDSKTILSWCEVLTDGTIPLFTTYSLVGVPSVACALLILRSHLLHENQGCCPELVCCERSSSLAAHRDPDSTALDYRDSRCPRPRAKPPQSGKRHRRSSLSHRLL
jgi:hypothetical protein